MRHASISMAFAVVVCVSANLPNSVMEAAELRVATFRCDVTPPLGQNIPSLKPMEIIDSPLLLKGVVLDDGRRRYVYGAVDWSEICNSTYLMFCRKIAEGVGTDPSRVAIHAIHQQAAPVADGDAIELLRQTKTPPPLPDPRFFEEAADRAAAAVKEAVARLQPFDRIGTGEGRVEQVGSTRRVLGPNGKVRPRYSYINDAALRAEPEGLIDPMLKTVTLAQGERPLVRLHFYACHPQNLADNRNVGYDFPGIAREELEKKEGVFQVYLPGCGGDVLVGKYNDGTKAAQRQFADRLLSGMEAAVAATRFVPAESLEWRTVELKLPLYAPPGRTPDENLARLADPQQPVARRIDAAMRIAFAQRIDRPLPCCSLQIGRVFLLSLSGEGLVDFQLFAQRSAPDRFVAVAANADFGPASVCLDRHFDEGGPEPEDANVGHGSEALMKAAIVQLLGGKNDF